VKHLIVANLAVLIIAGAGCASRTPLAVPGAVADASAALPAIPEQSVRAHMEFLASDALNGRGSGTRDEWLAATYIAAQFRMWGLEPMGDDGGFVQRVEVKNAKPPRDLAAAATPAATWNAVGRLTGSDPAAAQEVIVLSAHLDHVGARPAAAGTDTIFNGADDDASGTVAVMTLAEALAKGPRPRRTIVFALFGSEERGGHGAGHFVNLPVVPLAAIVADLQFEMLGRPDPLLPPETLWLTGFERSTLGPELAKQGAKLVADPRPDQSFFTRSDNIRFARRGIIAHTVSSFGMHKQYHGVDDEIALIDFAHMTRAINSLVAPIRALANGTFRPSWNPGGCPAPCK
jgi:hypothetical protein